MKGYDVHFSEPGLVQEMHCLVCNTKCEVKRKAYGPTGSADPVGKKFKHHDLFVCPYRDEEWHGQALRLVLEIEKMPSKRIVELMKRDLEDLLKENGAHK